jgi:hypothetical protein
MSRKIFILAVLIIFGASGVALPQAALLNVFIDCQCDMNYIRQKLPYVNYVRDQAQADVKVFINSVHWILDSM